MIDGIIYKLFCKDFDGFYIGSTTDFYNRKTSHKSTCNNEKNKDYNEKKYQYIRDNGGYDNWNYEILEENKYEDKNILRKKEGEFIRNLKPSLNVDIPNRTPKQYREDNKERITQKKKKYYESKKDIINQKHKEYHKNNKDIISKQRKEYYENHKEHIQEKAKVQVECEVCNCNITLCNLSRHKKTHKHINNLNKI